MGKGFLKSGSSCLSIKIINFTLTLLAKCKTNNIWLVEVSSKCKINHVLYICVMNHIWPNKLVPNVKCIKFDTWKLNPCVKSIIFGKFRVYIH